mgnify:CR=1 FL=1
MFRDLGWQHILTIIDNTRVALNLALVDFGSPHVCALYSSNESFVLNTRISIYV